MLCRVSLTMLMARRRWASLSSHAAGAWGCLLPLVKSCLSSHILWGVSHPGLRLVPMGLWGSTWAHLHRCFTRSPFPGSSCHAYFFSLSLQAVEEWEPWSLVSLSLPLPPECVVVQAGSWLWRVYSLWSLVGRSPEPERPRSEQGREQTRGDRGRWVPVSRKGRSITGHGRAWAWALAHPGAAGPSQESFSG